MAKRRKRRSLGSTAKQHRDQLDRGARFVESRIMTAEKALDSGACKTAAKSLLAAAAGWGEYNVHAQAGGSNAKGINMISGRYGEAKDRFLAICTRERNG